MRAGRAATLLMVMLSVPRGQNLTFLRCLRSKQDERWKKRIKTNM